jgi:hypothetical protein
LTPTTTNALTVRSSTTAASSSRRSISSSRSPDNSTPASSSSFSYREVETYVVVDEVGEFTADMYASLLFRMNLVGGEALDLQLVGGVWQRPDARGILGG